METKQLVNFWKTQNIKSASFRFDCGGDSMGDLSWDFTDDKGYVLLGEREETDIRWKAFREGLENCVFDSVTFYEASDGHYEGEYGCVIVELIEDDFYFTKNATSIFSEQFSSEFEFDGLTKNEKDFFQQNINSFSYDEESNFGFFNNGWVFKRDLILSEDDTHLLATIENKILEASGNYELNSIEIDGEIIETLSSGYTTLGWADSGNLKIFVSRLFRVEKDSD